MPPASPAELVAILLLAAALVIVPSALAFALFSLARNDPPPAPPGRAALARHSPRRPAAGRTRHPPRRFGDRSGPRRFGDR